MKTFADMTEEEFRNAKMRALDISSSKYREFFMTHQGYEFVNSKGEILDKWEVFGENLYFYKRVKKCDI